MQYRNSGRKLVLKKSPPAENNFLLLEKFRPILLQKKSAGRNEKSAALYHRINLWYLKLIFEYDKYNIFHFPFGFSLVEAIHT